MSNNDKLELLLNQVSTVTGYPVEVLKSDWRKRQVVEARHAFCIAAKSNLGQSLKNIAKIVNYKGHATVIWAIHNSHIPEINKIVKTVKTRYYANV